MNVGYSKAFIKAVDKLSGKQLDSVRDAIREVKQAQGIEDITDCTRLVGYHTVYRIRILTRLHPTAFHLHNHQQANTPFSVTTSQYCQVREY